MTQQEGFSDNLKQLLGKAKGTATANANLTLGSLAAAAIFSMAVVSTPTEAASWGQVLDALKNVGLGIIANAPQQLEARVGNRQGKLTLEAVAQELDAQAQARPQVQQALNDFVQQLPSRQRAAWCRARATATHPHQDATSWSARSGSQGAGSPARAAPQVGQLAGCRSPLHPHPQCGYADNLPPLLDAAA